jgi:hypothetical protein
MQFLNVQENKIDIEKLASSRDKEEEKLVQSKMG